MDAQWSCIVEKGVQISGKIEIRVDCSAEMEFDTQKSGVIREGSTMTTYDGDECTMSARSGDGNYKMARCCRDMSTEVKCDVGKCTMDM